MVGLRLIGYFLGEHTPLKLLTELLKNLHDVGTMRFYYFRFCFVEFNSEECFYLDAL